MKVKFVKHPPKNIIPNTPGEAVLYELDWIPNPNKPNSKYYLKCHKCGLGASVEDHEIIEKDGIITISPSIQCPNCPAHYFIKNGEVC